MTDMAAAVAIVGMAGRFPGARDLGEYWDNLRAGACSISDFSVDELIADGEDPAEVRRSGYVRAKGHLDGADRFEAQLFGFNPAEAAALDPQHRLLLETAWAAWEDAGYDPRHAPRRTGVYVGGSRTEHMLAAAADRRLATELGAMQLRILTDREFLAPWVSYRLGLSGPSITVATACSTSLTAVHLAVQALLLGECDAALAGGVSVDSPRKRGYLHQDGGIFSPDGRCRPFDERAGGTVGGSGVGVVVLRRLEDAIADGDAIHAVIRGTAVTNDGSAKVGFTAPSVERQTTAIVEAWAAAGLDPSAAQYIEMHGTGTELGDRVELAAAAGALGQAPERPCGIGSVKSNIGHLDAAAGVASLIKVVLMLGHRTMAPTANVDRPHPDLVTTHASAFRLITAAEPWSAPAAGPRLAGVNALGIGGTNVHVVVEEAPEPAPRSPVSGRAELLPLSANTPEQLARLARRLAAVLRGPAAPALADVGYTLRTGRAALPVRAQVTAGSAEEAARALEALAAGRDAAPPAPQGSPEPPAPQESPAQPAPPPDATAPDVAAADAAEHAAATDAAEHATAAVHGIAAEHATAADAAERRRLSELGERWVSGEEVDWPAPAAGARRVHLPAYPFGGPAFGSLSLSAGAQPAPEPVGAGATGRLTVPAVTELLIVSLGLDGPRHLDELYFAAGGDSLTAVHLVSRLHDEFGVDVPIELFLEPLTLRQLAERITAIADGAGDGLLASLLDEVESRE